MPTGAHAKARIVEAKTAHVHTHARVSMIKARRATASATPSKPESERMMLIKVGERSVWTVPEEPVMTEAEPTSPARERSAAPTTPTVVGPHIRVVVKMVVREAHLTMRRRRRAPRAREGTVEGREVREMLCEVLEMGRSREVVLRCVGAVLRRGAVRAECLTSHGRWGRTAAAAMGECATDGGRETWRTMVAVMTMEGAAPREATAHAASPAAASRREEAP